MTAAHIDPSVGESRPGDARRTATRGPWAWLAIVGGWAVMVVAVIGAIRDPLLGSSASWIVWVLGVAVVHDAVVLPIVVGCGWLLGRFAPAAWRAPWRVALVVGAVLVLSTWPIARRWGARSDNPSILPLEVGRNLLVLLAGLALGALLGSVVNTWRIRRAPDGPK